MLITPKTPRFSQLSASRQALVRVCQDVNFGQIEAPRPEGDLPDFRLSSEILRLMRQLDQLKDGRIAKIEIREGIPRRLVAHLTAALDCPQSAPGTTHPP
jgi:hypothetical protein